MDSCFSICLYSCTNESKFNFSGGFPVLSLDIVMYLVRIP